MTSFEVSAQNTATLHGAVERVRRYIMTRLGPNDALAFAIASSARCSSSLLAFMASSHIARLLDAHRAEIALTPDEWSAVCTIARNARGGDSIKELSSRPEFYIAAERVEAALRCSIDESCGAEAHRMPIPRALSHVAIHMEDAQERLSSVIGTSIRADSRRVEEMTVAIDDDGVDVALLSRVIVVIADMCHPSNAMSRSALQ